MAVTVTAVLFRSKEVTNYGFILRQLDSGEHVVYKIAKNTPADMCFEIEVGDLLLEINSVDVRGLTMKDVLKRIRMASDTITMILKKDDNIKQHVYSMIRENSPDRELPTQKRQPPEEVEVELFNKDDKRETWGFAVQWTSLLEHVVTSVSTPARGKVEVGDVLVTVNGVDVQKMSFHNVVKLLARVPFPIQLKLKRDPWIKNYVREQFAYLYNNHDDQNESGKVKQLKTGALGSPGHQQKTVSTSQLAQPKNSNQPPFSPPSPKGYTNRECQSESGVRKSRIPVQINQSNSWSAPQSPSRARKAPRTSQIPMAKTDVKISRYVITGKSQFLQTREEQRLVKEPASEDSLRKPSLVQYNTLSSSTSNSQDISSSYLPDDNANASAQSPDVAPRVPKLNNEQNSTYDKASGCGFPDKSNAVPFHAVPEEQREAQSTAGANNDAASAKNQIKDNCDSAQQEPILAGSRKEDPTDQSYSVPTSPTAYTAAAGDGGGLNDERSGIISLPTSPDGVEGGDHHPHSGQFHYGNTGRGAPSSGTTLEDSSANAGMGSNASSGELTANTNMSSGSLGGGPPVRKCDAAGFRTSRSEDHLQQSHRDGSNSASVAIDIDEDVYSSLNTLLDTRNDSQEQPMSERERFLWTYNMPPAQKTHATAGHASGGGVGPNQLSLSSSVSSSPQRSASESPASPTSVSSSVMSSSGGSREHSHVGHIGGSKVGSSATVTNGSNNADAGAVANVNHQQHCHHQLQQQQHNPGHGGTPHPYSVGAGGGGALQSASGGDHSVSEAVSNLSSPDYQDEHDLFSSKDLMAMAISDHSDSDSTILVSESTHRFDLPLAGAGEPESEHKLVIEVKADESRTDGQQEMDDVAAELQQQQQQQSQHPQQQQHPPQNQVSRDSSPPISDDGSDVESLHSFHYSPKAIDRPSVERLARRLFYLEGFSKKDICRHLSKNNEFSRVLGDEYLKYYNFTNTTLDVALRAFVKEVPLFGETQERERVMYHFSKRYLDNNPGVFKSVGATHYLVSALLILNSDTHGEVQFHRTFSAFSERLKEGNDGENFPKDLLKHLYSSIKDHRLEPAIDDDSKRSSDNSGECYDGSNAGEHGGSLQGPPVGPNPFLEAPRTIAAVEFKKGYVVRKSCYETNHKRTPFGRRSWKMFYCTLRDLVLYLHNDEHGYKRNQISDNVYNGIRIHHALATRATDYSKRNHVFRLQTADQSEFLFQTSDSKELQSWIDTINFVCAAFSSPPLEGAVGSQKRFQRPLLPCSSTKLSMREQLASHELQYDKLCRMLEEHKESGPPSKGLALQNYREKDYYLQYELKRYKTYCQLLLSRLTLEPLEFGNQHTVSAAALNETSQDDENGEDDGHDDEHDDELLSEPIRNAGGLLAHHRFQATQSMGAMKRSTMK
ncbi:PH and SEC7 domain-containing protein isoform X2 [Anopheles coustani]|uniref:PH and SEC7 domain-containing protein isoform X2 n=1 Tax=Anopheles coustani TaxID=139045 RepID=UPI002657BE90|nr:PH and SEC7 domain-containing protein isoform X2 [Anopheles coustani]